ncbi:hypothetical protein [Roseibacillus ishigakijimensis]|uniref:hypothetical protein n=1 Tax=Roseibacillus ishigakijimensis TaxID=454146 RepID=UPI001905E312|nr:hypothetical protein [Roseibacillus ishigakijimensis]
MLTGVGGFFLGKESGSGGEEGAQASSQATQSTAAVTQTRSGYEALGEPNLRGYELAKNPRLGLETLLEELRNSPMSQMDFETLFGIWDMVQYLGPYELQALLADLDDMTVGQEGIAVRMMLLNRWAARDGASAMEHVLADERGGMLKMVGAMGAMMGWMRADPEQAYSWFKENGEELAGGGMMGMGQAQVEAMYFAAMAKKDFPGTMAKLDEMESDTQRAVITQLAQSASGDPAQRAELLDYLAKKNDDDLLLTARETMVSHLAWQDPQAAVEFLKSGDIPAEEQADLSRNITNAWANTDPEAALDWRAGELAGSENAGQEISDAFGQWVRQDEAAAAEWLTAQGDEFKTDEVFQDAGQNLIYQSKYDRAAAWYSQVLDDNQRQNGLTQVYEGWKRDDSEAAEQWRATLPAADQSYLNDSGESNGQEGGRSLDGGPRVE